MQINDIDECIHTINLVAFIKKSDDVDVLCIPQLMSDIALFLYADSNFSKTIDRLDGVLKKLNDKTKLAILATACIKVGEMRGPI